jgi:hypothetical protein
LNLVIVGPTYYDSTATQTNGFVNFTRTIAAGARIGIPSPEVPVPPLPPKDNPPVPVAQPPVETKPQDTGPNSDPTPTSPADQKSPVEEPASPSATPEPQPIQIMPGDVGGGTYILPLIGELNPAEVIQLDRTLWGNISLSSALLFSNSQSQFTASFHAASSADFALANLAAAAANGATQPTPEPAPLILVCLAALGPLFLRRRQVQKHDVRTH